MAETNKDPNADPAPTGEAKVYAEAAQAEVDAYYAEDPKPKPAKAEKE